MKRTFYLLLIGFFVIIVSSCSKKDNEVESVQETVKNDSRTRFLGNYNREFNDLHDLHLTAALQNGVQPIALRSDTLLLKDSLVRLPDDLELFKMYDLTHSIPFLVPSAAKLLTDISINFRDSLYRKHLPLYKLNVTSVTRTEEDLSKLIKRNTNASDNSAHRYGTTFDVSWKRFDKIDSDTINTLSQDKLKLILAQVLFDLKSQERCYIKHERNQACFHITVR